MKIGGFQKLSLIDYPGKISCIVFTIGCNFRCPYCYVPQLVLPEKIKKLKEVPVAEIFSFLQKNKGLNEAVVITGGEPTIHPDLPEFIRRVKAMGYSVALETNGTNFRMLKNLVEEKLVDYVELDIKNKLDFEKYNLTVGGVLTEKMFENIKKSIKLLLEGKIAYEFRTTLVKEFHRVEDIVEIAKAIKGGKIYYLQNFRPDVEVVGGKRFTPMDEETLKEIVKKASNFVRVVRR
ncbi:MAG: anaerobic ribonucleoside-triphosphate reductase activating protein [Candidatus Aenigmarchaeota archaeon ex4484_224]|nr:MAG: anaerobic ribonucleoside-triphosphate reductase activating protein [Candidatus Aenigmarchaeota archaeon ex4484_224]